MISKNEIDTRSHVFESATDRITPFKFISLELNKLNGAIVENPLVSKRRATLLIDPLTTIYPITSSPFFVIPLGIGLWIERVCHFPISPRTHRDTIRSAHFSSRHTRHNRKGPLPLLSPSSLSNQFVRPVRCLPKWSSGESTGWFLAIGSSPRPNGER